MKLRKGMLGALLGVTFATTLLATNSVHAETSYTGSVETNQSTENKVGWQKIGDYWYYFDEPGKKHIGWLKLNNNWYYFDKYTGIMHIDMMFTGTPIIITGETYYFNPKTGAMQTGWVTYESGDKYYFYSDGRMARNTKIGEYTIDNYGRAYIENYTGWQKRYDDWTYYENGKMITGWKFINNNWYYFDLYGRMATGLESPIGLHGGGWYLFDSSGVMKTGWQKYNGEWCYFGSSGNMHMGWQKIDSKWYYFGPSKNMPELWTVNDKGVWYEYNISGAMKTGWQKINGTWYYFANSGAMKTGWLDYAGQKYYLQSSGAMATNTTVDSYKIDASGVATKVIQNGWQSADNHWYYYTNGKKVTGWKAVNNVWYYFDGSGVMKTGWQKVNGVWYYFNPSGAMQKGWQKIDGAWYYFGTSGAMKTGWLDYAGQKYYLKSTGAMATNTTVNGYKIDASGVATKIVKNGWQSTENHWYYYTNGKKVTGWKAVNNVWYYFDSSGVMKTGWQKINGVWYYFNPSGAMQKGWQKINGAWYYFGTSGAIQTGWLDEGGKKYYLQSSGAMATNTTVDGYKIDASGVATKVIQNGWQSADNHWYYYTNGKKVTGWKAVNNVWYYFDGSGVMKTGWQKINGVWYYFNPSGAMQKGWQKINGAWYYFGTSGAMKTGWLDEGGKKYYLQSSGAMATNTTVDGYKIDASGVATDQQLKDLNDTKHYAFNELKALTHIDTTAYQSKIENAQAIDEIQSIVNEAKVAETKAIEEANKPKPGSVNSILTNPEAKRTFILTFTQLLNEFRKENGLKEIYSTTLLNRAADIRSEDEKNGLISKYQNGQTTPDWNHKRPDGSSTASAVGQAAKEGYNMLSNGQSQTGGTHTWINENIAINFQMPKRSKETPEVVAQRVFTQWKNSAGHRANMLDNDAEVFGIGFWGDQSQSGPYIEFTFIGGKIHRESGFTLQDIQLFQ
ncbi:hypothetical protein MMJ62_11525 [Enterococcus cecorum]|uniref:hypothetical protein n=1 Tax=Enterococcus cecorum TaxID=44008 RepID=UPI001FABD4BB|nr:hypothetical protein [Enterococcus cecorum]MCJ0538624.1 hypothetical protein [Enterococcus cecorum]MCJ0551696.1 hypothetical protein [Enterococcus cecorum]MCJ0569875.1 hypothetical protein [Enterococcus cecorum]